MSHQCPLARLLIAGDSLFLLGDVAGGIGVCRIGSRTALQMVIVTQMVNLLFQPTPPHAASPSTSPATSGQAGCGDRQLCGSLHTGWSSWTWRVGSA